MRADGFCQGGGFGDGQAATQVDPGRGRQRGGDIGQAGGQLSEGVHRLHRGADMRADARRLAAGGVQGGQRLREVRDRDAELGGCGTGRQVRMGRSVQCRVQTEADARVGVVCGQGQEGGQLLKRLRIDQRAGAQRQVQLLIPLAHTVHHDALRGYARPASERKLDGRDHLGAGALAASPRRSWGSGFALTAYAMSAPGKASR